MSLLAYWMPDQVRHDGVSEQGNDSHRKFSASFAPLRALRYFHRTLLHVLIRRVVTKIKQAPRCIQ